MNSLSQLVKAVNEQALELRQHGVDAYTVDTPEKWHRIWRFRCVWELGDESWCYFDTLGQMWDALEKRLEMNDLRLEEKTHE